VIVRTGHFCGPVKASGRRNPHLQQERMRTVGKARTVGRDGALTVAAVPSLICSLNVSQSGVVAAAVHKPRLECAWKVLRP
jgi:hypothetical protein